MKIVVLLIIPFFLYSQSNKDQVKKGSFYFYWGWNNSLYSKSDIHFKGKNYDFTLYDVCAKDRQSPFNFKTYFSPTSFTIPQYNYRLGYYFSDQFDISLGMDHMKYVMIPQQEVIISGTIQESNTSFDGNYNQSEIILEPNFLQYEHTDGLNYVNTELRKTSMLSSSKNFKMSQVNGLSLGLLIPRSNVKLLDNYKYDEFHLAGYGIGVLTALRFNYKQFFIQSEIKGGWINLTNVRTTSFKSDHAKQSFFYSQFNIVFGFFL